jgi:hypothetical protein
MATDILRVRFLSLEDAETQSSPDVVLYIKKLVQVRWLIGKLHRILHSPMPLTRHSLASKITLEEKTPDSPVLCSFDEKINLRVDDEFCQVLFISLETKEVLIDHLLIRNELLGQYFNDPRYNDNVPLELIRTVR